MLGISREQNRPDGALQSSQLDFAERGILEFYGNLRVRLKQKTPDSFAGEAARNEKTLRTALEENYFDLGKWAEAGRLAAIAQKPFSPDRQAGYLLKQLKAEKDADVPPAIVTALETAEKLPADGYGALKTVFEQILEHYYPQGRPSDL